MQAFGNTDGPEVCCIHYSHRSVQPEDGIGDMRPRERFLAALHQKPTDRPAVGNAVSVATVGLMEQTGCYFPDAHLDPDVMVGLARSGYEVLGYDTIAPVFSVQHEADALGCDVDWGRPDLMPEAMVHPCKRADDIHIPDDFLDRPAIVTVLEALKKLKALFKDEVAIVGKVFGPWTLAYHPFGVENFLMMTIDDPAEVHRIVARLKEVPVLFGEAQIKAGADVLTLADHATGELCSPDMYREFLMDVHSELVRRIHCPLILHICGNTADRMDYIAQTHIACFHFESRVPAAKANSIVRHRIALMGNINNPETLLAGTPDDVWEEVRAALEAEIEIIAPECAVPLTTPVENLQAVREAAVELA